MIVALGMALVIGTEGVDLSVGSVMALAAALVPLYLGYGLLPAHTRRAARGARSLGRSTGCSWRGWGSSPSSPRSRCSSAAAGSRSSSRDGQLVDVRDPAFLFLGSGDVLGVPFAVLAAAVLAVATGLLVSRTTFGRRLVAIGDNRAASALAGLPVRRVLVGVYAISGVLAAFAGVLATARLGAGDPANTGLLFELSAITAVVVGGTPLSGGQVRVRRHGRRGAAHAAPARHADQARPAGLDGPDGAGGDHHRRRLRRSGARPMTGLFAPPDPHHCPSRRGYGPGAPPAARRAPAAPGRAAVLVAVVVVAWIALPRFGRWRTCATSRCRARSSPSIALGMTFVIITGGIDLSVGSVYALGGCSPPTARTRGPSPRSRYPWPCAG